MELKAGDIITIPEGCKAIVKDGSVKIVNVQGFNNGDILITIENEYRRCPFIYKNTDNNGLHSFYAGINTGNTLTVSEAPWQRWGNDTLLDYATEEEKQLLFDMIKKKGLRWNAEEKRVEKIRWRARRNKIYYYVKEDLEVANTIETYNPCDNKRWNDLNYFKVEGQAEQAVKRIREVLRQYHEEIGE
jgi:hypothetical protein